MSCGQVTTFRVSPGRSLFLGGLIRFDYETGRHKPADKDKNLLLLSWFGVLPGHLTKTESTSWASLSGRSPVFCLTCIHYCL